MSTWLRWLASGTQRLMPLVFLPPRPRQFAEPDELADDLSSAVEADEPALRRAFLAAVVAMVLLLDDEDTSGGVVVRIVNAMLSEFERVLTDRALPSLERPYLRGATFARDRLPEEARLGVAFDLVNPRAVAWAEQHAATMVTQVSDQTRKAIRAVIVQALAEGASPEDVARRIRPLIGLTARDALAVGRLRTELEAEERTAARVDRLTQRYANRLLRRRAQTIARHETMQAANAGQLGLWRQTVEDGLLVETEWERRWMTAHDERTCAICRPLDGKRAPMLGGSFPSGYAGPPAHVICRCTCGLVRKR